MCSEASKGFSEASAAASAVLILVLAIVLTTYAFIIGRSKAREEYSAANTTSLYTIDDYQLNEPQLGETCSSDAYNDPVEGLNSSEQN